MVNDRHTARFRRIKEEVSDRVIVMGVHCNVLSRGGGRNASMADLRRKKTFLARARDHAQ